METHDTIEDGALVTRRRAADLLAVSLATINRMVLDGKLERRILSPRCVRITTASLKKIIEPTTQGTR